MTRALILSLLFALVTGSAHAGGFLDARAERAAAEEAEKRGDWDAALLHYENIYDSTRATPAARSELRVKMGDLRRRVPPNPDESKAGVFKVRVNVFRALDVQWLDENGPHHAKHRFTDKQLDMIRKAVEEFQAGMWELTGGQLKIECTMKIIEGPLRNSGMFPGPNDTMHYFTDLKPGDADCLFVIAKDRVWPWEEPPEERSDDIPSRILAATMPVLPNTKGAIYIAFNMYHSPNVMIHEFLHAVSATLDGQQGYPQDFFASSDSVECLRLIRQFATRKMWRELSLTRPVDNPWVNQYCRRFLVTESFDTEGRAEGGLDVPFIDEDAVAADLAATRLAWRPVSTVGHVVEFYRLFDTYKNRLAYLAVTVDSGKEQVAQLRLGSDGPCKVWQNGKLIFRSPRAGGPDESRVTVRLKEGPNRFLMKVGSAASDWWRCAFRISDTRGNLLPDVQYALPEAPAE